MCRQIFRALKGARQVQDVVKSFLEETQPAETAQLLLTLLSIFFFL